MKEIYEPKFVEKLFDKMSSSYSKMNYITSFGFSERWRRQCVEEIGIDKGKTVVDLMTGMGECWKHILKNSDKNSKLIGLDFSTELGNDDLIEYQIKTTYKFLLKLEEMQKVQKVVFNFLKKSVHMNRNELQPDFINLKNELDIILKDKYERRPTLYLDIISWLESKLSHHSVEEIIKKKDPKVIISSIFPDFLSQII